MSAATGTLAAFMAAQTSTSPTMLVSRRNVVAAFLRDNPGWLTTTDADVEAWMEARNLGRTTRNTYRGHLRAFYRFARDSGLVDVVVVRPRGGPGTAKTITGMHITPAWQRALTDWMAWLRAAGRPETTMYLRGYQIGRLAQDSPVDPFDVSARDLLAWLAAHQWSPESRRSYRSSLRSFYTWAHTSGQMGHNPAALLPPVSRQIRSPHPTPEDVLAAALATADPRVRLMVLLGARLGLRRGEVCKVHTRDVVASAGGWSLRVTGKGRRQRVLPLAGELQELLAAAPAGYLFPGDIDGHLSPAWVGKVVSRLLGVGWTSHALRHRFATVAHDGTHDLLAVQTLLGHSRPETTMGYVALPDESLRAAVASAS